MSGGPYTCCRCCADTWNDDDWCDACRDQAAADLADETLDAPETEDSDNAR